MLIEILDKTGKLLYRADRSDEMLTIRDCNLAGAALAGMNLQGAFLEGCNLSEAEMRNTDLYGSYLAFSKFDRAILDGASLRGSNLNYSSFQHASLVRADLSPNSLGGPTIMENADLRGANLLNADLTAIVAQGTVFDDTTIFPGGFSPAHHGMRHIQDQGSKAI